jgi:hypothetical protein
MLVRFTIGQHCRRVAQWLYFQALFEITQMDVQM